MKRAKREVVERRAIRVIQTPRHPLFLFALSAKELQAVADISRVFRDAEGRLQGYQRPKVKRHVRNITEYLDSEEVIFPNPIILALNSAVIFKKELGPRVDGGQLESGVLCIPIPAPGQPRPAWIVDGQQRALALAQCRRQDLLVPVNAFIADEVDVQRDQFLRVNSSKPLPRGLITELLPEVGTLLPPNLAARRVPAALCDLLNRDRESPFKGLIRRNSMDAEARRNAIITDMAIVTMIKESLTHLTGCLFPYRNVATLETDFDSIRKMLLLFWTAVKEVFPEAWGLPPSRSRLMHGTGVRAMGRLMDKVMSNIDINGARAPRLVKAELLGIRHVCRWTEGHWEESGLAWNQIQNTPQHIRLLSHVLIRAYTGNRRTVA
ncbi:DGQHR domain-containing protein [Corallococcus sp. CA047B]|uniref:DGQHR domain-containing protein DpdB n=1 Tax=Corallococcus sp. CA047B TaxID=2316729 RepID=UPI000EA0491B|nr:DGQHR domain-containing protein DpdB [Corallococcus sp. CA047B]RKH18573.1 DGQHR domain-containing protein [Corallococcus sp. CA047B]